MARLRALYGFRVSSGYRFRLAGKKYRLGPGGVRALKLIGQIVSAEPVPGDVAWLLPFRGHVREIRRIGPSAALTLLIDRPRVKRIRYLAIWLRGRCGGTFGTPVIARFSDATDRVLRKEVTRCLKRLAAWPELRHIASTDPDPHIRRMATQAIPRPYGTRLAEFSEHLLAKTVAPREAPLIESPGLDVTGGKPPKSSSLIRGVLERIHRLVTGSSVERSR